MQVCFLLRLVGSLLSFTFPLIYWPTAVWVGKKMRAKNNIFQFCKSQIFRRKIGRGFVFDN